MGPSTFAKNEAGTSSCSASASSAIGRSIIRPAKAASSAPPSADRRVTVREHRRWIAARITTSGNGTRSAVPMIADTTLMRRLRLGRRVLAPGEKCDLNLWNADDLQSTSLPKPVSALGSPALPEIGASGAFFGLALCHSARRKQVNG
ncbi:hypothetical protein ACVWXM_002684 [Bradyrhizobium sp. GM7.3]